MCVCMYMPSWANEEIQARAVQPWCEIHPGNARAQKPVISQERLDILEDCTHLGSMLMLFSGSCPYIRSVHISRSCMSIKSVLISGTCMYLESSHASGEFSYVRISGAFLTLKKSVPSMSTSQEWVAHIPASGKEYKLGPAVPSSSYYHSQQTTTSPKEAQNGWLGTPSLSPCPLLSSLPSHGGNQKCGRTKGRPI